MTNAKMYTFLEQNNVARTFLSLHRKKKKNRHRLMFEIFYL